MEESINHSSGNQEICNQDKHTTRKEPKSTEQRLKKRVFVDMDGVLVDFQSGIDQQSEETLRRYEGHPDDIPGIFSQMKPIPGAIEAIHKLQDHYDLFILSTAPWGTPSAWADHSPQGPVSGRLSHRRPWQARHERVCRRVDPVRLGEFPRLEQCS